DLTVPPEELPSFYDVLAGGHADFVQGTRLVYPMEPGAMRFFNKIGNVAFSELFTYLLQQPIKDTLCGTKVLWRKDYERIAAGRSYFGDFDPFGDFDLIFGAARLGLKIAEIPVRYRDRSYGETNISRWKHGVLLLRMSAIAARKIKFVRASTPKRGRARWRASKTTAAPGTRTRRCGRSTPSGTGAWPRRCRPRRWGRAAS